MIANSRLAYRNIFHTMIYQNHPETCNLMCRNGGYERNVRSLPSAHRRLQNVLLPSSIRCHSLLERSIPVLFGQLIVAYFLSPIHVSGYVTMLVPSSLAHCRWSIAFPSSVCGGRLQGRLFLPHRATDE